MLLRSVSKKKSIFSACLLPSSGYIIRTDSVLICRQRTEAGESPQL